jgi:hexosaminidase
MSSRAIAATVAAVLAFACAARAAAPAAEPAIVPAPASLAVHRGTLALPRAAAVVVAPGDTGARRVAANFIDLVGRTHQLRLQLREERAARSIELVRVAGLPPEGYRLEIDAKRALVSASTDAGFAHATATLWQMLARTSSGATLPAVSIEDAPRFAWRGIMLDSARHFQSPGFIRRFLDWMALHKLNVLHWHLTDDQGWRLEIRKYPRLTGVGAWRVPAGAAPAADIDPATGKPRLYGGFYSQETVRSLVAYAAERAITIVPEIEMPGHASAAVAAYPRLAAIANPSADVPADWGVYPNVYNADESTFAFLEDVLREVMELFPAPYIHVGGDEVEKTQWRESPAARERARALGIDDPARLQAYFTQRIARFLEDNGRRLVGWDEILEPGLARNAVVMSWRGIEGALGAAAKGHDTVLAAHPTLYFDNVQALAPGEPPGRGRVISAADVYAFEPMPAALAPGERGHVLGLQGNVWTEHIRTEERVAWMSFPRAAAVAELGWSQPERRGWEDFQRRMGVLERRYPSVGLRARPIRGEPARALDAARGVKSQELRLCTENIALSLEDDAPLAGPRAAFLVDIQNPCWILAGQALDRVRAIAARVGQVPFNFQIGEDVKKIGFADPQTPAGELEVHLDSCAGEILARLPLAPATASQAVSALAPARMSPRPGRHDLCLRFAQRGVDPLWVIDSIQLLEKAP